MRRMKLSTKLYVWDKRANVKIVNNCFFATLPEKHSIEIGSVTHFL